MSQRDRELESRLVTAERERLGLKADLDAQRYVLTEMQSLAAEAARIFESIPGIERNGRDIGIRIDAWKKALASAQPAAPARHKPGCAGIDEERMCECDESLVEQLDEALCTLLHDGGEVGEHSPRTHLDLFYARQAQPAAPARADEFDDAWTDRNEIDEPATPAREEQPDEGPDHGEADPNYPPHRKYFQPYRSLNSGCSAPLRRGLHQIVIKDGRKSCSLCGAGEPAVSAQVALEQLRSVGRAPARAEAENKEGK